MEPVQIHEGKELTHRDWVILKDFYSQVFHIFVGVSKLKGQAVT